MTVACACALSEHRRLLDHNMLSVRIGPRIAREGEAFLGG